MTTSQTALTDVLAAVRHDRGLAPDRPAVEAVAAAVLEKLALLGYEIVASDGHDPRRVWSGVEIVETEDHDPRRM